MNVMAQQTVSNAVAALQAPVAEVTNALAAEVDGGRKLVDSALKWLSENGPSYLVSVLVSLVLLLVGARLIRLVTNSARKALHRTGRVNELLETFVCSVVHKGCWALLLMVVAQRLGINVAPLIAGLGVTGFIMGFAFQESLSNLAAGMMIALNQPFKVGDYVSAGGVEGAVLELNMMAATLATADYKKVIVPNKVIWGTPITNFTATDRRRVEVAVGIAYGVDIGLAKRVALDVLRAHAQVLADPLPMAEVMSMGDSSVNLVLRAWVKPADYWAVYFALTQSVKEAFDRNGVAIPFPQLDVHVKNG